MYNNYNYYPQQPNQQAVNYARPIVPLALKGRPVSSLDEARASSIDFDGSIFYFPDLANKCIYTKQINMDGTATLNLYELKSIPLEPSSQSMTNYITREEFEQVITQLKQMLAPVQPITEPTPQKKMEVLSF
jgi:hypothetical protein